PHAVRPGAALALPTFGRACWWMAQIARLPQLAARGSEVVTATAHLFQPGDTYAIRFGSLNGTPMPHEEPLLQNPPAGVVAYYWLKSAATRPLKVELLDGAGAVRSCVASDTPVRPPDT